jgi:hypothetical protein
MMMNNGSAFGRSDLSNPNEFISIPSVAKQRSDSNAFGNFNPVNFEREEEAEDFFLGSPQKKNKR